MNKYINIYTGEVTAGGTDGTAVSFSGDTSSPLIVELDATKDESKIVKCAVRCESGYSAAAGTVITFDGTNKAKWSICSTEDGTFADSLTIADAISTANILFYVKVASSSDESPAKDTSVKIKLATKIESIV